MNLMVAKFEYSGKESPAAPSNPQDQSLEEYDRRLTSACNIPTPDFLALSVALGASLSKSVVLENGIIP
jgi:hypothetical protein